MKTKTKFFTLALCALLLVVTTVFATVAFLTANDTVNNTFTVGNVSIVLDEADVDGSKTQTTTTGRDKANQYKLIPGKSYLKDPVIHVGVNSEDCWLFVKIAQTDNFDDFMSFVVADGWTKLTGVEGVDNVYFREVSYSESNQDFNVIKNNQIIVSNQITKDNLPKTTPTLTFTAYAVQKAGFETAAAAWGITD